MSEDLRPRASRADEAAARYRFHGWEQVRPERWCALNVSDLDSFVGYARVRYTDSQLDQWVKTMAMIGSDPERLETARLIYLKTKPPDDSSSFTVSSSMSADECAEVRRRFQAYRATPAWAQEVWITLQIRPPAGRAADMFIREYLYYGWQQVTPEQWCAHHQIEDKGPIGEDLRFTADERFDHWRQQLAVIEHDPAQVEAAIHRYLTPAELAEVEYFRTNRKQWDADRLAERIAAGADPDQPYDFSIVIPISDRMSDEEFADTRRKLLEERAKGS